MTRLAAISLLAALPAFGILPNAARNTVDQITDVYKISFPRTYVN